MNRYEPTTYYTDEGDDVQLPTKWAICENCHGNGSHVNRAIDGNGISTDDECWQDDQFTEMYFSGGYDVRCDAGCDNGKIRVVDEDRVSPEIMELYYTQLQEFYAGEAMDRQERMMGA